METGRKKKKPGADLGQTRDRPGAFSQNSQTLPKFRKLSNVFDIFSQNSQTLPKFRELSNVFRKTHKLFQSFENFQMFSNFSQNSQTLPKFRKLSNVSDHFSQNS